MSTATAPDAPKLAAIDAPDAPPPPVLPVTEADFAPDFAELSKLPAEHRVLGRDALGAPDVAARISAAKLANATFASTVVRRIQSKLDRLRLFIDDATTRHEAAAKAMMPTAELDAIEAERTLIATRLAGEREALEEARQREADAKAAAKEADAAFAEVRKRHKLPDAQAVTRLREEIADLESKLTAARGRFQDHVVAEDAALRAREMVVALAANTARWEKDIAESKTKADEAVQNLDLRLASNRLTARRLTTALAEDHDATRLLRRMEARLDDLTLEGRALPKGTTSFDLVQGLA